MQHRELLECTHPLPDSLVTIKQVSAYLGALFAANADCAINAQAVDQTVTSGP